MQGNEVIRLCVISYFIFFPISLCCRRISYFIGGDGFVRAAKLDRAAVASLLSRGADANEFVCARK